MKDELDVIAAGLLCLDIIPRFNTSQESGRISDILKPGSLVHMKGMALSTGGSVSNVGIAMKIFGCRVGFMAKVGDDTIGKIIIDILKKNGNTEGIIISEGEESSYTVVISPPKIDRIFLHCPGTNDTFTSRDINFSLVEKARLFHLGYPTLMESLFINEGEELTAILKKARDTGAATSLDISLPDPNSTAGQANWRVIYQKALPYVDIFVPSIEEAFFTLYPDKYKERKQKLGGQELIDYIGHEEFTCIADEFLNMGCKISVLKAGHNGWYLKSAGSLKKLGRAAPGDIESWSGREIWCPAFYIEAIASATGSGDSSIAAFLTALLRGHTIEDCLKLANCAGYLNLKSLDAFSGLPSWDRIQTTVPALAVRENSFLSGTDWTWNEVLKIWEK